ncbi:sulfite exporter TauE/SafE family protein [Thalassobius vesicularis]|uniref:sulfite exporter TauE/SafE family protein n=1 Tax=Thalassobius vesicularis TaxID=1294297 RepID=UPI001FE64F61|nr:sulfite exporter TauE/SafE family protein [Thalassobius vesicularis]
MTPEVIAIVAIGFVLGGILKGATGVGAPLIAVPLLAAAVDVRFAIVVFSIPNLVPNIWQVWAYRKTLLPRAFIARFVLTGMAGAAVGTWVLANVHTDWLVLGVAGALVLYIVLRLARPGWMLSYERALPLAPVAGFVAGTMQTAAGLSAPVSITFLNAMRLRRETFMPTASAFFVGLGLVQLPLLIWYGLLDTHMAALSAGALIPLVSGMPIGAWLGRKLSQQAFDRIILGVLSILAAKLIWGAFA